MQRQTGWAVGSLWELRFVERGLQVEGWSRGWGGGEIEGSGNHLFASWHRGADREGEEIKRDVGMEGRERRREGREGSQQGREKEETRR